MAVQEQPDYVSVAMGYVQRLANGNTLIGWGATNPSVTEVTSDGKKVYEMSLPDQVVSYRAFRYQWNVEEQQRVSGSKTANAAATGCHDAECELSESV
jgi:hypothetical protein